MYGILLEKMRRSRALMANVALIACMTIGAVGTTGVRAADADCADKGGKQHCNTVEIKSDWKYSLCDDWGSYLNRRIAWCIVLGGVWRDPGPGCYEARSPTEASGQSDAEAFESLMHSSCQMSDSPTEWGVSYPSTNCWASNGPLTVNGVEYSSLKIFQISGISFDSFGVCNQTWAENVVFRRDRDVACPAGFSSRTNQTDSQQECFAMPPCSTCIGNPIDMGNGSKRLVETDFSNPAFGGISVIRYYNSLGFFDNKAREPRNSDFWKTNWSARIVGYVDPDTGKLNNPYVSSAAVRPNGAVRYFARGSGQEVQTAERPYSIQVLTNADDVVTGWVLTTDMKNVELYSSGGDLQSITTSNGLVYTVSHDGDGNLASVTDPFNRTMYIGNSGFTDFDGNVYTYGYDEEGRLSTVTYPGGATRTYLYEDSNWKWALTGIVDERGKRLATYTYAANGLAVSTQHAGGRDSFSVSRIEYATTVSTSATDAYGTVHSFGFQKIGGINKLISESVGSNPAIFTYDANGRMSSMTRNGIKTMYSMDAARNLELSRTEAYGTNLARTFTTTWHETYPLPTHIGEPGGVSRDFGYDATGNLLTRKVTSGTSVREWDYTVNPHGQVLTMDGPRTDVTDLTTVVYYPDDDACLGCRGQPHTVTNPAGQVTSFDAYDPNGRPTQVTDPNGVATMLTYTPRGWLTSYSAANETTHFDYDPAGNLRKVTQPDGGWFAFAYDDANGLVGVDDSVGDAIDYQLDVMGNRVSERSFDSQNTLHRSMQHVFNAIDRLQKDLGAAAQATQYTYDTYARLTSITDPLYRQRGLTFDYLDRISQVTDPAGTTSFTYDARGNVQSVKDPRLLTTAYAYDGFDEMLTQNSPDTGMTTFTYDLAGNVASRTDARNVTTTYAYDALNRPVSATVPDGTVTYAYDDVAIGGPYAKGHLTTVTDPSGSTSFAYDARGRVVSKTQNVSAAPSPKTFMVGYGYTSGNQSSITYPSGHTVNYGFDAQGRIASLSVDGVAVLAGVEYDPFGPAHKWTWSNGEVMERVLDLDGRMKTLTLGPSTTSYPDLTQVFTYDSVDRLLTANLGGGHSQSFTYDANGNRTSATIDGALTNYAYPSNSHRLSSLSGAVSRSFTYDAAGNATAISGVTFAYDGRGRMKQAASVAYLVNGLGERVKKTGATETYFAYDEAGHLIGEYDGTGAPIEETLWLADTPVAVVKPDGSGGFAVFYIWSDHLNTPRMITDAANYDRWEWPNADPFGNNAPIEDPSGQGVFSYNLRFPGQYYDVETGKHYNYYRDYDSSLGRYLQSDPIGLNVGTNTYLYVDANPLVYRDPYGLDATNFNNTAGGRSRWDWPTNGNWGGKCWSGGKYSCGKEKPGDKPPTDSADACYMRHDNCYIRCADNKMCVAACDGTLVKELMALPDDPKKWPQPPRQGTESDSRSYRDWAIKVFK